MPTSHGLLLSDVRPAPLHVAVIALARCAVRTFALLARHAIRQPRDHVGNVLCFADGSHGRVYRETVIVDAPTDEPVLLVVSFRLRGVRGFGHALFRAESLLNTVLFAGFPGLVSKLWLAHDEHGVYRGVYQWNDAHLAETYVQSLWWVLALVSVRGSIHSVVVPGLRRDDVLTDPHLLDDAARATPRAWWQLTSRA
jgi:hypothetical protein